MVSIQTMGRDGGRVNVARTVAMVLALCCSAGCAMFHGEPKAVAAEPAAPMAAPVVADARPQTAVDAAIARGDSAVSSSTETSGAAGPVLNASAPKSYTV